MKFADVVGQEAVKSMLIRGVDSGRVSHAQLFTGRSGSGMLPLALAYVQYINCTDRRDGDSCGVCSSCVKMSALAHPDLHFVMPTNAPRTSSGSKPLCDEFLPQWRRLIASTGGYFDEKMWYDAIGLDNQQGVIARREADEVIKKMSFKSFEARYKCVVLWLPEKMRPETANALLKILEEPWENTLFILVSEEPQMLLPTILSRTQEIAVPRLTEDDLERYALETKGEEKDAASAASRLSGGDLLELTRILSSKGVGDAREYFDYFVRLMRFSYNDSHLELLEWAEEMAALGRENQKGFLEYSTSMLRESYIISAGLENISYLWGGEGEFCSKFAPFIGNHNIEPLVDENRKALRDIVQNGNAKIIFTHYALTVSKLIVRL